MNEVAVISSVSLDWVEHERANGKWIKEIEVPMVTIDDLVAKYGMPRFIKLDVEGFETRGTFWNDEATRVFVV